MFPAALAALVLLVAVIWHVSRAERLAAGWLREHDPDYPPGWACSHRLRSQRGVWVVGIAHAGFVGHNQSLRYFKVSLKDSSVEELSSDVGKSLFHSDV